MIAFFYIDKNEKQLFLVLTLGKIIENRCSIKACTKWAQENITFDLIKKVISIMTTNRKLIIKAGFQFT